MKLPKSIRLKAYVVSVLLAGTTSLHAAENLSMLEIAARYGELAGEIETRLASGQAESSTLLGPLCLSYSRLKRFDKLFGCVTRLETRIAAGDVLVQHEPFPTSPTPTQAQPIPGMLLAEAYMDLGDYPRAVKEGERALAAISENYETIMGFSSWPPLKFRLIILPNLTISASLSGDRALARKYLDQLASLSIGFINRANHLPMQENGLARGHIALGDYAEAIKHLGGRGFLSFAAGFASVASGMAFRGDNIETQNELQRLFMLGKAELELGHLDAARDAFATMLGNKRLPDLGDIYWVALFERGRLAEKERDGGGAIDFYRKAVDVIEQQRSTINTEASKIGFVGDKQAVYGRLIAVLIEQGRTNEAFDYVERSKSRALVDMLAAKKDFAAPDPSQATLVLAQLDAADLNARVQDSAVPAEAKTAGVRNLQVAREALQSAAPELSTLVTVSSVPSAELKALVGPDETLVEYYYQGNELYAFLLDRERLLAVKLDATELSAQVHTLRKNLEATESAAWQAPARALYARLWQPLEKLVTSRNLIVVAHGALHYLPFAALQDGEGKFLLDRYSLRFLPSASVLKFLRPVLQTRDARLLALGNPDLDDPKLDLAFAEGEAKLVASLYPASRVLLRKDASESNFKKAGGVFSRIHFASHGKFQADEPLKSGLYLAKDADNDGILTVGELYSMNLEADLVTLSACETGLGKIASGDDVVGLTRGFLYAGSRSIVASLWSVDDKATATLMQAFYRNLTAMNKREALRQAQIKAREAFPHPFFWAAFQLTGRAE